MKLRNRTTVSRWRAYTVGTSVVLFVSVAIADRPAPQRQYTVASPNGKYEFTMRPAARHDSATIPAYGEAVAVSSENKERDAAVLWRVDGWYSSETFITDDGHGLVRIGPWASKPPTEELAVAFYRDGKQVQHYVVADLIDDTESLRHTVSHYTWQAPSNHFPRLQAGHRFQLLTVENRLISFDVVDGRMLDNASYGEPASSTPQVTRESVDDQFYAENLFRENGIDIDASTVTRVLRDDIETVVWANGLFGGLPVFYHEVGYSFDASRTVTRKPDTGEPQLLGQRLAPASSFPTDHQPDIEPDEAIQAWLARAKQVRGFGPNFRPRTAPEATLGFHNLNLGRDADPIYRLVWRVRPRGSKYPVAMVGANKGDIVHFDSGIRTLRPPLPPSQAEPGVETLAGSWRAEACGARGYARELTLHRDGGFSATDYVAPCPENVTCIWSGIVTHNGSWRLGNARMIELTTDSSSPGPATPVPGSMGFEHQTDRLHEATPGGAVICEYQRIRDVRQPPEHADSDTTSSCYRAVQGRIAWDYQGHTRWNDSNVSRLCAGAPQSTEPARCFEKAMHGSDDRGEASGWRWQHAIELCAGTTDADAAIECFEDTVAHGTGWRDAAASCRLDR